MPPKVDVKQVTKFAEALIKGATGPQIAEALIKGATGPQIAPTLFRDKIDELL
jgi:hypothetical protein